ncbi:hypothetical protein [Parabacteroides sp.]
MKATVNLFRIYLLLSAILPLTLWAQEAPVTKAGPNPAMPYKVTYSTDGLPSGMTLTVEATTPPNAADPNDPLGYAFEPVANGGFVYSNGDFIYSDASDPASPSVDDPDFAHVAIVRVTFEASKLDPACYPSITYQPVGQEVAEGASVTEQTITPTLLPGATASKKQWSFRMPAAPVTIGVVTQGKEPTPEQDGSIVISNENNNDVTQIGDPDASAPVTVPSISVETTPISGGITLANIKVEKDEQVVGSGTVTIGEEASLFLNLEGTNSIAILNNNGVVTLTAADVAKQTVGKVINTHTFTDETGLVQTVYHDAADAEAGANACLSIVKNPDNGLDIYGSYNLVARVASSNDVPSCVWQKMNPTTSVWEDIVGSEAQGTLATDGLYEFKYTVSEEGTYRCRVTSTHEASAPQQRSAVSNTSGLRSTGNITTTLCSKAASVTLAIPDTPDTPGAPGTPVTPGTPPTPTGNAEVTAPSIRAWLADGLLRVSTPEAVDVSVYDFNGHLLRSFRAPSGESVFPSPGSPCIVKVGVRTFKLAL